MADTLVERATGQAHANQVPVEVNLLIDTDTLLNGGTETALIEGVPIPAATARELVLNRQAPTWLRRLYTRPTSGELVTMDSRRRLFTTGQRRFLALRDQACRTPWREAPIRHGGKTSLSNGAGLCVACNTAKQAPGWHTRPGPGAVIDLTTPTGHRYRGTPPRPPGTPKQSPVERQLLIQLRRHAA